MQDHNKEITQSRVCDTCGAHLTPKENGSFTCEYCGATYGTPTAPLPVAEGPTNDTLWRNRKKDSTRLLTLGALLTAMVVVLQLLGSFIRLGPFSISLVLIPIVIGAASCGPLISSWLGLVFGAAVLMSGDAALFLGIHAPGTVLTVLLKGLLCGLLAGLAYKGLERFNRYFAVLVSAIVCPVANTGVFLLGCRLFFWETIAEWGNGAGFDNPVAYAFLGLVGANFLFEMGFNLLLSPIVVRLLNIKKKLA